MDKLHEEISESLQSAIDVALDEKTMDNLKKKANDIFSEAVESIEYNLKYDLARNLSAFTVEMASKTVTALLEGNEQMMRQYLSCREGWYNGRYNGRHNETSMYARSIAEQHAVIHGRLFEQGPIKLRADIVAAHRDLIASERILDLEDQVKSLVAQVNKKDAEHEQLIERLRQEGKW